ncbi:MAG: UDP-N-acetylmuramate dehydrogenase [Clostridiales bacterium]|nr:UDP-N-acetylmuramate dehydrogenase [Clostridiales bacterium]
MENIDNALNALSLKGTAVKKDEPMSLHTTFKTGGAASFFVEPSSAEETAETVKLLNELNLPYVIIGNGSNLLVSDKGYDGFVIKLGKGFSEISVSDDTITAEAGASLSGVAAAALREGLEGFEFAAGIPGSIGGGVCMNAGAYGGELKDVITKVTALNNGEITTLENKDCNFGYRISRIMREGMIVLKAEFKLTPGDRALISEKMNDLAKKRSDKQPLNYPSAGSTFKRPEGYFAGKLIEDTGLRGFSIGGAQVSEKHCGFIINRGEATSSDIYSLICEVQKRVFDKFGVELQREVRLVGDFD